MNTPSEHRRPRIECSHALFKALENIELRRALQVVVKKVAERAAGSSARRVSHETRGLRVPHQERFS